MSWDKYGQIIEPEDSGPEFVASDSGKLSAVNNPDAVTLNHQQPADRGALSGDWHHQLEQQLPLRLLA